MYIVLVLGRTTNDVLGTRDKITTLCHMFQQLFNSIQFDFSYYLKIGTRSMYMYLYIIMTN